MAASAVELCSQDANKAQDEAKCFIGIEAACLVLNLHIARARLTVLKNLYMNA